MLQRYEISINDAGDNVSIREFAVLERIPKKYEFADPTGENYSLIHEITYESELIRKAMSKGKKALISEIRTHDFFPNQVYAELIADKVIELFDQDNNPGSDLFIDDQTFIPGEKEEKG